MQVNLLPLFRYIEANPLYKESISCGVQYSIFAIVRPFSVNVYNTIFYGEYSPVKQGEPRHV